MDNHFCTFENGVCAYKFETMNDEGVRSLFTTRIGGVSPDYYGELNLGCSTGDSHENVLENCRRVAACMGTTAENMVTAAQTHTKNIRIISKADAGKGVTQPRDYENIDGLITSVPGLCLFTGHADCNPVLFYDPQKRVIAAIHSGWMGTLLNISAEAVTLMKEQFDCNPKDIQMAIGPALCRDCFEVDVDVAEKFLEQYPYLKDACVTIDGSVQNATISERTIIYRKGIKYYIDLKAIIEREVLACGLLKDHIEICRLCTKETPKLFHSHRLTGTKRGVMGSAIMLIES